MVKFTKIGIITLSGLKLNFGTILQNYSLQKTLTNESRQCFNICQKNIIDAFREKNILFSNFLLENKISINNQYKYQDFDKILIGSDQVMSFSASWYKYEKMLLPEISADKKFFYAGATSNNVFHNLSDEKLKYLYDNYFKYVSTYSFRDIENYEDLKKSKIGYLFKNSSVNIDPVFLLDKKAWISIEKKPKLNLNSNFVVSYYPHEIDDSIPANCIELYNNKNIGPAEFLWMIHNCNEFYTNSFHGFCFGLIFNKIIHSKTTKKFKIRNLIKLLKININDYGIIENNNDILFNIELEKSKSLKYLNENAR